MPRDKAKLQYLIFLKYQREYLSQATGYSRGYLSKVASGSKPLSEVVIARCCYNLKEPAEVLFRLVEPHAPRLPPPPKSEIKDLLETVDELASRLTKAEREIEATKSELRQYR